jgi:hypothetical protein
MLQHLVRTKLLSKESERFALANNNQKKKKRRRSWKKKKKNASVFYCLMIGQSLERLLLKNGGAGAKVWVVAALAAAPFRCC